MSRIVVHIDRLVLRGVDVADREQLATVLRDTLSTSLAEPAMAERIGIRGNVARLSGLTVSVDAGEHKTHSQLGTGLGQSIARSLGK